MAARVMRSPQVGVSEGECAPALGASQAARIRNLDENEIVGGDSVWEWQRERAFGWLRGMDTGMDALFKADSKSTSFLVIAI